MEKRMACYGHVPRISPFSRIDQLPSQFELICAAGEMQGDAASGSPMGPMRWYIRSVSVLFAAYDEAVRTGRIAIELTPDSPYTCFYLAMSLAAVGLKDEAWGMANMGRKLNDGLPLGEGYFGYVAGVLGHVPEARTEIGELQARRERGYGPALPIAWTYLGLSETASALEWLETALAEHDPFLGSAMVFPAYDAIHDQARFMRLTHELNLPT